MTQSKDTARGLSPSKVSIVVGALLTVWSTVVSLLSQSQSITSWIPAFFGLSLLLFVALSHLVPSRQKLWVHLIAGVALLGSLGGLDFFRGFANGASPFVSPAAGLSKLALLLTNGFLLGVCIRSFALARKLSSQDK